MKRRAQHQCIAALQPYREIDARTVAVDQADVDGDDLRSIVIIGFTLVIVAVVFGLDEPFVRRYAVLHPTKQGGVSAENEVALTWPPDDETVPGRVSKLLLSSENGLRTLPLEPIFPQPTPRLQSKLPLRLLATRYSLEKRPVPPMSVMPYRRLTWRK